MILLLITFVLVFGQRLTSYEVPDSNLAVLILSGGGYKVVAQDGVQYAQWLNSLGVSAYVLDYRPNSYPLPMQDAKEAFGQLRAKYKIVGVLGQSAGGHLAASIQVYDSNDRPDFLILLCPVISMTKPYRHKGSWRMLFGDNPDANLMARYSVEEQVTKNNPPAFIVSGGLDISVPLENSIDYYMRLRRNGIPAEIHIFQNAVHGFWKEGKYHTLGIDSAAVWPILCENWMRENRWVK